MSQCFRLLSGAHRVCSSVASLDTTLAKRVLRHRRSRRYFRDGEWTRNPQEATNFHNIRKVVETCVRNELRKVDLILSAPGISSALTAATVDEIQLTLIATQIGFSLHRRTASSVRARPSRSI